MKWNLIKRENASEMVLIVMIWGVASLLLSRLFLELTGYPKIGRGIWHVSHALFGGMIMTAGMIWDMVFWGNRSKKIAAGIFGFGLGWFIDEIGKLLTMDYNYFFRPAIIFIYIFFVLFFILYRYLEKIQPKTTKELLYNAIDRLEEVVVDDLEKSERKELISDLKIVMKRGGEQEKRLAGDLYKLVVRSKYIDDKNNLNEKIWQTLKSWGYAIFSKKITLSILIMVAVGYVVVGLADTAILWTRFKQNELWDFWLYGKDLLTRTDISMFSLKAIADLLTSIMFGVGIFWVLRKRRKRGINFFQYGLLVNIFLASVFRFYFEQFSGIFGLALSVAVYNGLTRLKREGH
ncbi:MAG: hypothetical protein WC596_04240 [Candidatus Shapirobacteria bacterium]